MQTKILEIVLKEKQFSYVQYWTIKSIYPIVSVQQDAFYRYETDYVFFLL